MQPESEIVGTSPDAGLVPSPPVVGRGSQRRARLTVANAILEQLRNDILALTLKPGTPLAEVALCQRFGVSRTPLREALIRLAEEGLVEIFPQSGTFVSRIPIAALPDAVVVRQALELAAIGLVIDRATEADFAQLEAIISRQMAMNQIGDQAGFHASDEAFHEALARIAGHPSLWRIAQQAKTQIDRCRRLGLPAPGRMAAVIGEHRNLLDALRQRDRAAAEAAMRAHLTAILPDTAALRAQYPDFFI